MLEVIGVGFGRTGTVSLTAAVEELGFGPCYHLRKMFERPEQVQIWRRAGRGEPVNWNQVFDGYGSSVGWPGTRFWRELVHWFPQAKVVLTTRDPDLWYDSAKHTIFDADLVPPPGTVESHLAPMMSLVEELIFDAVFDGRLDDPDRAIAAFNRHNDAVRQLVPAERLLEFDVTQGWEPLCHFLDVPVPDRPFPRRNDRKQFATFIQAKRRQLSADDIAHRTSAPPRNDGIA
ncbi:sulfotransferase family protein [Actinomadura kijaniata]|uniref:sulfotransferase family protein n=1 Tax=Actinomadura kijaniata TaxID=46161 RepID=UPI00082EBEAA|nr:sulfotransferase family protein [Actinomadura kijaniata]